MNNYKFDSIVSKGEAEALKEMIFKRARERAEALNSEVQSSYTSDVRNDIMEIARDSFTASKNPFSQKTEPTETCPPAAEKPENDGLGFSQRRIEEVKQQINYRNRTIAQSETEGAMTEARADFRKKQSFMGALNFLNSQASIVLVKKHGKSFDAIA